MDSIRIGALGAAATRPSLLLAETIDQCTRRQFLEMLEKTDLKP
jgi:hypothetical protein